MLIDFHVHTFPDKIADMAIKSLSEKGGLTPITNGTLSDTVSKMKGWGVDKFVSLNISTNPKQESNVNDYAISIISDDIIPFGSVHPNSQNALFELEKLKSAGVKGVKFHPEYQEFNINDKNMYPIYQKCCDLGLFVVFHAGYDIGFPDSDRCQPKDAAIVANEFSKLNINFAHMGGWRNWDMVIKYLVGINNVYFDTAFIKNYLPIDKLTRIIKTHGCDRILFGSDCPWENPNVSYELICSLDLSNDEKDLIFYKNAKRVLNI